ncbi:hypothetical protein IWZ00DRAFT_488018 [Phyllosticta capitalensis]
MARMKKLWRSQRKTRNTVGPISQSPYASSLISQDSNERLMKLPAELLYEIDDFLDDASALAFRLTCHRTRDVFAARKSRTSEIATQPAEEALRQMLVRDATRAENMGRVRVKDALRAEKKGKFHIELMQPCSKCGAFHDIKCFSREQLKTPPQRRLCLGHERGFYLCEHKSLNFFDFARLPTYYNSTTQAFAETGEESSLCSCSVSYMKGDELVYFFMLGGRDEDFLTTWAPQPPLAKNVTQFACRSTRSFALDCDANPEKAAIHIHNFLLDCRTAMCPHVRVKDLEFGSPKTLCAQIREAKCSEVPIVEVGWRCRLCPAQFSLTWEKEDGFLGQHLVKVCVLRAAEIFNMNGAQWLAISEVIKP